MPGAAITANFLADPVWVARINPCLAMLSSYHAGLQDSESYVAGLQAAEAADYGMAATGRHEMGIGRGGKHRPGLKEAARNC